MKNVNVGALREGKLRLMNKGRFRNRFIKCDTKGLDVIKVLEGNLDKISTPLYNLPIELIHGTAKTPFAVAYPYLYGYKTLNDVLKRKINFNKDKVADNIVTIVNEYESLGMNYFDLHDKNFMLDSRGKLKVVDVDGADLHTSEGLRMNTICNFWDLIIEMYLYHFYPEYPLCVSSTYGYEFIEDYFSKEFIEYLDAVIRDDYECLSVNPGIYLPEFHDQEKIQTLSKKLEDKFVTYKTEK